MQDYGNRTFDEIEIGASATATRTLTATDVEALALAAGYVEGLHIEGYDPNERLTAQGAAAIAMIAGLVNRRLPGPGARIILSRIHYSGIINIGDPLAVSVSRRPSTSATTRSSSTVAASTRPASCSSTAR